MPTISNPLLLPATHSGIRPGDFAVGSQQSRAAARALLDARLRNAEAEPTFRVVIRPVVGDTDFTHSTCRRTRGDDGSVFELIELAGCGDDISEAQVNAWVKSFPVERSPRR